MGEYVWARTKAFRSTRGDTDWRELLNYEVGALAEVREPAAHHTSCRLQPVTIECAFHPPSR
jgi:hypothetical protein